MQRPNTAFRHTKSKIDTNIPKPGDKKASKKKAPSLSSLVRKRDRIKSAELIEYLELFLQTCANLKDFRKVVGEITDKIMNWKKSYGDLDQQEKMIREKFSNAQDKVVVHNIKTILAQLARV